MWKNLYQKTVYEAYKSKEHLGYKIFEFEEMFLDNCFKYVGYIDDNPAGTLEFSEGSEAAYVAWGAVKPEFRKRGLYKSMLIHAINHEIDRGFNKIVLNSSEMGKEIYAKMGFIPLAERNNYVLEKINE